MLDYVPYISMLYHQLADIVYVLSCFNKAAQLMS